MLAQHAKDVEDYVAWLEECPSILEHVCAQVKLVIVTLFVNKNLAFPIKKKKD